MIFYDFEVFKYDWLVVLIDTDKRKETVIVNDPKQLEEFYNAHKHDYWVGFNSRDYDRYILQAILCGFNPKEVNDWMILKDRKGWEFSDVMRKYQINNFDVKTGFFGLKQLEAFMGNDIRESSVPFDIDRKLTSDEIEETIRYCRHDVEQTIEVFLRRINEFNAQRALVNTFDLPIINISQTQAQLASKILGAKKKMFDDEWEIRIPDTLELNKYHHIAEWFLNPMDATIQEMKEATEDANREISKNPKNKQIIKIMKKKLKRADWTDPERVRKWFYARKLKVKVAGVPHIFGWGGIHGAKPKFCYTCEHDEYLVMADVDQLYPTLMVEYGLLSRAVKEPERFKTILDTSLRLKAEKKKVEREPYKRICNITYGTMGDKHNPMFDPLHRNLVCVYGQLLLLDLIEKLEPFCTLIQSNTDGILMLIKKIDFSKFDDTVYEWEERTHLHMSFDFYESVYQGDVNNYIVVDDSGGFKSKGAYVKKLDDLDNDLPIVNRAITQYIINGVHPRDTVYGSDDLIDFQKVVKVSGKYAYGVWNGNRLSDKTFRVFASTRLDDGIIGKVKKEGANVEKFANTPEKCFIWNESVKDVKVPDHLDRDWYVDLAVRRIEDKFGLKVK